ncbi:ATP synthase protein I [Nitrosomonas ureae]|uniref:ATP synthase protein I n=1 Tax=Nitrosomonas ureae TaxID=44577 RepID=A0A285BYU5_9PROT|nr:ATP synthase subunit I [Nitrosomonas ureae]SNX60255.1 ATP synthase protein I [Nitrosomonas ureae]
MSWIKSRSLKIVLLVQLLFTFVLVIIFMLTLGKHGAISAMLGGGVNVISSTVFALIVSRHQGYTAGGAIRTALRAEAVKIILIIGLLWMVFKFYTSVNALVFIGTFILMVLVYSMVLLVADNTKKIR